MRRALSLAVALTLALLDAAVGVPLAASAAWNTSSSSSHAALARSLGEDVPSPADSPTSSATAVSAKVGIVAHGSLDDTASALATVTFSMSDGYFSETDAGFFHSVAVDENGDVFAWGNNDYGQLGDGTFTERAAPVWVNIPEAVSHVAAGDLFSVAVAKSGAVYVWGRNQFGALARDPGDSSATPLKLALPAGVKIDQVDAGVGWVLARSTDGAVYSWATTRTGNSATEVQRADPRSAPPSRGRFPLAPRSRRSGPARTPHTRSVTTRSSTRGAAMGAASSA